MAGVCEGAFDAEQLLMCLLAVSVIADGVYLASGVLGTEGQLHQLLV